MAGKKTTGSIHSAYRDHGTSTKDWFTSINISTIKTALDGVLPTKYKIKSLKIHIDTSFTCKWDARVYIQAGLSTSTSSIGQTILEEKQIGTMDTSGSETYTRDITSYLTSTEMSSIKTTYGSYLVFRMQSGNVFKKTFTINSVTLEVEWYDYYTATFKNGETVLQTVSVLEGATPSYTGATPTKERDYQYEYTFSGWSPSIGAITGNTTYTAQFSASDCEYIVEVICEENSRSGQKATVTGAGKYRYGDTVTLTAVAPPNHEFTYWIGPTGMTKDNPLEFKVDETYIPYIGIDRLTHYCTIYHTGFLIKANVTPENAGIVEHGVLVDLDGDGVREKWYNDGTIPPEGYIQEWDGKESFGLKAVPNNGYKFVRWSDGNTENPRLLNPESDVTITAVFEKIKYTVEISYDTNAGTVTGAVSGTYEYGTKLTLTATPKAGYYFDGWSFDWWHDTSVDPMDNPITFTVLGEECVLARMFEIPKHQITIESTTGGTVTGAVSGEYAEGTEITLQAKADQYYKFVGWSDGEKSAKRTITVSADATYKAIFEKMKGTVILDCYDEFLEEYEWWLDHVTITGLNAGENVLECGQEITLTIECRDGYICDFLRVLVTDDDDMSIDLFPGDYNGNSLTFKIVREGTTIILPLVRKERGVIYVHTSVNYGENEAEENNCTVTGLEDANELDIGQEVTLTAVPDKGYRCVGIAVRKSEVGFEDYWGDVAHCMSLPDGYTTEESSITFTVICDGVSTIQVFFEKLPEFTSVDMIYLDKQISPTNKVIAGQSFIISATIE